MALQIMDNFSYKGKKANFDRDSFKTLEDMKSVLDSDINEGHISYCEETDKHYKFNSSNEVDSVTGKWREFITGSATEIIPKWKENTEYKIDTLIVYDGEKYKCIKDNTSTTNFDDTKDYYIKIVNDYAYCTKEQYDYLKKNNLLKDIFYVIDGSNDEWKENTLYTIGEQLIYNNEEYECIIEHTSSTDFSENSDKFVKIIDGHIYCTKEQYDYLNTNDLLKDKIYIVNNDSSEYDKTISYSNLSDKPSINDIALDGNKSLSELGINTKAYIDEISIVNSQLIYPIEHKLNTKNIIMNILDENYEVCHIKYKANTLNTATITFDSSALPNEGTKFYITVIGKTN